MIRLLCNNALSVDFWTKCIEVCGNCVEKSTGHCCLEYANCQEWPNLPVTNTYKDEIKLVLHYVAVPLLSHATGYRALWCSHSALRPQASRQSSSLAPSTVSTVCLSSSLDPYVTRLAFSCAPCLVHSEARVCYHHVMHWLCLADVQYSLNSTGPTRTSSILARKSARHASARAAVDLPQRARAVRSACRLVRGLLSDTCAFPREDVRWGCARVHVYVYCT